MFFEFFILLKRATDNDQLTSLIKWTRFYLLRLCII